MMNKEELIERYRALRETEGPRFREQLRDYLKKEKAREDKHRALMQELVKGETFECAICDQVFDAEYAHLYFDLEEDTEDDQWICGYCSEDIVESSYETEEDGPFFEWISSCKCGLCGGWFDSADGHGYYDRYGNDILSEEGEAQALCDPCSETYYKSLDWA